MPEIRKFVEKRELVLTVYLRSKSHARDANCVSNIEAGVIILLEVKNSEKVEVEVLFDGY